MIDVLWRVGFLRAQLPSNARVGSSAELEFVATYQIPSLNLDNAKSFQIHPMFCEYLGIK
jgi:hypothetical protein